MSLRIRLRRVGRKKQPSYRIVVANSAAPRDGAYVDELGFYNPRLKPAELRLDLSKVDTWLGKGATLSTTAASLVRKARKGGDAKVGYKTPEVESAATPAVEEPQVKAPTKPRQRPKAGSAGTGARAATAEAVAATEPKAAAVEPEAAPVEPEAVVAEPEAVLAEEEAAVAEPENAAGEAEASAESDAAALEAAPAEEASE